MALTDAQKADVRRHLGFGPVGSNPSGGSFISYRFFVTQGQLEFRINNLAAEEELVLLGNGNSSSPANPNFIDPATNNVIQGYLNICNFLEGQIATATDNLDIVEAGEYKARQDEVSARAKLYVWWCQRMAQFLYVAMGTPLGMGPRGALVN